MRILSLFITLSLLLSVTSCKWLTMAGTPYFSWTNFKVPEGTPTFQQGYKDGCSSVLYARGNVLYRTRYKYQYDPKMIGNPEYRFGHSRGYTWCFQQVLAGTSGPTGSFDKYINPYGYDTTFNAGKTEDAWDGFFGKGPLGMNTAPTNPGGFDEIFGVLSKGGGGTTQGVFTANPLWAGGSAGQFFGQ